MSEQKPEQYDPKKQYPRHEIAYKDGGIHNSKVRSSLAASVFGNLIKKAASQIIKGEIKSMNEVSKPVQLCVPLGYQEVAALDNLPTIYLDKAAEYTKQNNPIKRLQQIAAFAVAGIPIIPATILAKMPLDPTNMGETHQLIKPVSKTQFQAEIVQVKPPISLAQLNSADLSWKGVIKHELQGSIDFPQMNSMHCSAVQPKMYYFRENDGSYTEIIIENYILFVEGLIMGERVSKPKGTFKITDKKNKLQCEIKFTYEKKSAMSSITKSIGGLFGGGSKKDKEEKKPVEYFEVSINKVSSFEPGAEKGEDYMKMPVSTGFGNYLEYMQMDGEVLWKSDDKFEEWQLVSQNLLQSDLTLRDARTLLQIEDMDNAEKEKVKQEKIELEDIKLRQQAQQNSAKRGVNVLQKKK